MSVSTVNINISVAGVSISGSTARTATGQIGHEVPLPAAKAATNWTKTDIDDTAAKKLVKRPTSVHIERVYDAGDFTLLGIGS
jgi:hypothetical protein